MRMPFAWLRIIAPFASAHLDSREIHCQKWPAPNRADALPEPATPRLFVRSRPKDLSASARRCLWAIPSQLAAVQMVSARMEMPIALRTQSVLEEDARTRATTPVGRMPSVRWSTGNLSAVAHCDSSPFPIRPKMDVPVPYLIASQMWTAEERCATMDSAVLPAGTARIAPMERAA